MKAKTYAELRKATHKMISELEGILEAQALSVEQPNAEDLRPATVADIFVGNIIFGKYDEPEEGMEYYWHIIDEVHDTTNAWYNCCGHDGCRYGLDGVLVER